LIPKTESIPASNKDGLLEVCAKFWLISFLCSF